MPGRRLGNTDLEISPIGLGCWQFAGGHGLMGSYWGEVSEDSAKEIVKESLAGGVNWFDTAEAYGGGRSEEVLSRALRSAGCGPADVVVATKWWPFPRTAGSIKRTIGKRYEKLSPFPVDLHQIHQPLALSTTRSQMNAMADLLEEGSIRAIGVSNFSERRMRLAHRALSERGMTLASNQVPFSLLERGIETNGILDAARELGVTIIAYSPLAQGMLTGKFHDDPSLVKTRGIRRFTRSFRKRSRERSRPLIEAIKQVAGAHGAAPAQIALAWLLQVHGDMVVAIPGASRAEHARSNAAAMEIRLSGSEMHHLDELSRRYR